MQLNTNHLIGFGNRTHSKIWSVEQIGCLITERLTVVLNQKQSTLSLNKYIFVEILYHEPSP